MSQSLKDDALRSMLNQAIDFEAVLKQIASFASFSASHNQIMEALPNLEPLEVKEDLALAKEGLDVERFGIVVPFGGVSDIGKEVRMAAKGMRLLPGQLLAVSSFLTAVKNIKGSLDLEQTPLLKDLCASMDPLPKLNSAIQAAVDLSGQIRDDASPELKKLSRKATEIRLQISDKARAFVKANSSRLMDTILTTISGRTCVLVKAQDKYAFGGMIHGQSQSGMAFYVEPSVLVHLNNQLQECLSGMEEEKNRICLELSKKVGAAQTAILSDLDTLTVLDVALAKGRWASVYDGCIPLIQSQKRTLRLEHARHPLIDPEKVVANDYVLQEGQNCLMISGPNMGGKTVTLKTIGLFVSLAQSGFPVIAHQAILPWYTSLWFDIGDNQSIENSLSTFSAHMQRISQMVANLSEKAFVLLDEVGNGTDPAQGAALAIALLEHLIQKQATIVTSTHYNEVKAFGKSSDNVLVSSVEFDPQTLRPTYKYIPGVSGASYAYSIADAFGLEASIIERAREIQKESASELEKRLSALEVEENKVRASQERFQALIADAHRVQKEAQAEKDKWSRQKEKLEADYEKQLSAMLEKKEQEANAMIDSLRTASSIRLHERNALMADLKNLDVQKEDGEEKEQSYTFKVGDYVRIKDLNLHGQITEIKKNKATLVSNGKKTSVKLDTLEPLDKPAQPKRSKTRHTDRVFARFDLELNIIGMRVEEGIQALDNYLDQAVYHKVKQVRIIHGMGTGKLRNAVWQDLKKQACVKSFNAGGPSDGGLGATIVYLK